MRYRKLDQNGDMVFGHGTNDYYKDQLECVAQSLLTRLQLWRKDWYLDTQDGTPYMQEILGKNTQSTALRALQERILDTEGVTGIVSISVNTDPNTRKSSFIVTVNTIYGDTSING